MADTDHFRPLGRVEAVERTARGVVAHVDGERVHVDAVRDDVVRLSVSRGGRVDERPTAAVCAEPLDVDVTVEEDGGVVRVRTAALVVSLHRAPLRIDVHRPDGSPVAETAFDASGRPWSYARFNDAFVVRRRCRPEDAIYGLGEKTGGFNRRGRDFTLWNTDVLSPHATAEFTAGRPPGDPRSDFRSTAFDPYYASIPFFHHHAHPSGLMAGSFMDNGYRATYAFSQPEEYRIHFAGGQYTEYLFAGPGMPEVLEAYTWLTGRMAPPPIWSLGYHQCRWERYTQDRVLEIAAEHRRRGIPCDVLWLDIDYMDGFRVFTWDREAFPDVPGMLDALQADGFRVVTIVDPGVKAEPGYAVYDEAVARDVLCRTESGEPYVGEVWPGDTVFPDFATAEARAWWGERNAAHVRSGLAGIWNDMNEPATGAVPPHAMRFDRGRASHERFHNQYALLMAMGTVQGLLDAMPDRRTFVLSRAGSAGIQRYAANWMGDNLSRWDHLWLSMPMAAGFGVSGQPFVGADVGGFHGHTNPELFLRWMQYGALTPFFRNHSEQGNVDQYAWAFGPVVERHVREAVRLRDRLLAYVYAAFLEAAETGAPVQRPLVFEAPHDPVARDVDDEYLFGPDLLVAPVTAPGATARQVYLPEGGWWDWHTGERVEGPGWCIAATPMDRIPLFARAGAVVPMWPQAPPSTMGHQPEAVELHLFVPADGARRRSALQEDDGLTFAADRGARVRTTLDVARDGDRVTVRAAVDGDGYPEFRRRELRLVVRGATPRSVRVDGADVSAADGAFAFANAGEPFSAEISL